MHPLIMSQIAEARHRELLAYAEQQRLARQAIAQARAQRRSERRARRAARLVPSLRTSLEQ